MLKTLFKGVHHRGPAAPPAATMISAGAAPHQQWLDALIDRMFQLMHAVEQNNFDADRYRNQPANAFFYEHHASYFKLLVKYAEHFYATHQLLGDETSRQLFDQLLLFRVLGHMHVRLPFNTPDNRALCAVADTWRVGADEDSGILGSLAIFEAPGDPPIRVKCWRENIAATFMQRQYYFNRGGVTIAPASGDHIIDAGGCFGDTALAFAAAIGESGHVYSFDPIPKHCAIIHENLAMNPALARRISVFELGLSAAERIGTGFADIDSKINPGATAFDAAISTTTIDKLIDDGTLPRVDFIKMDIEGSELDALKGAERTIREFGPRLAISLYHRPEDFIAIPLWIDGLDCGYRFYLDHYSIHHEETVLYATP